MPDFFSQNRIATLIYLFSNAFWSLVCESQTEKLSSKALKSNAAALKFKSWFRHFSTVSFSLLSLNFFMFKIDIHTNKQRKKKKENQIKLKRYKMPTPIIVLLLIFF